MANWIIRRAKASDAASLATCIDTAYSVYAGKGIDLPPVSEGVAEEIRDHTVWVAVLDGRIIGGLILVPRCEYAVLANLAVDPSVTGLGLGRSLIDQAEHEAQRQGFKKLKLSTHVGIPENVRLYEYLGWRETGRKGSKIFMEKPLPQLAGSNTE